MPTIETAKHTPGPWIVSNHGDANHHVINPAPGRGNWLFVLQHNGEKWVVEQDANARLIAAAPDLLELIDHCRVALTYYREILADHTDGRVDYPYGCEIEGKTREIIAKMTE